MDDVSQYKNFCMIQFFKINSKRQQLNALFDSTKFGGIEWKSFPELHLSVNVTDSKCTIEDKFDIDKFDIDNNAEVEKSKYIQIPIFVLNEKTMKAVATEAVGITDYKRQNITKITLDTTQSKKLIEFIKYFNDPDWFFVYSSFTKTKSNAEKSTDNNNYEITLTKSTVVPDNKLYISKNTDDCHSVAMFNNTYFAKKTKSKIKHNVNNTESTGSSGGKRNPDRERIYKLPIHKRRTDNYYNYE
jgi:hypothetical protein